MRIPFNRIEAVDVRGNNTALLECMDQNGSNMNRCAGKLGCKMSHLKALRRNVNGRSTTVIFEDDFAWLPHVNPGLIPETLESFGILFPDWKVIGLSMNILSQEPMNVSVRLGSNTSATTQVVKILDAQTTHGYAVRASYVETLTAVFQACDVQKDFETAIDQCWKALQAQGGWYGFAPQLGTQTPGRSDIENMEVKYDISK